MIQETPHQPFKKQLGELVAAEALSSRAVKMRDTTTSHVRRSRQMVISSKAGRSNFILSSQSQGMTLPSTEGGIFASCVCPGREP